MWEAVHEKSLFLESNQNMYGTMRTKQLEEYKQWPEWFVFMSLPQMALIDSN